MHVRNHVHGNKSRCMYILQLLDNCLTLSQLVIVSSLLLFNVLIVMQKNFPNHHHLHKIFNLNTIKLSYNCMSNMSSFIKQHNHIILSLPPNSEERLCNCKNNNNCSLAGSCLKTCIVYRADVIKQNETHYGASDREFKYWYSNTQIRLGIKIMKTKLNSRNIFGS